MKPEPGRIEQRSNWTRLQMEARAGVRAPACGHALEILTCSKLEPPGLSTNHGHAWIRLWRDDGCYASVGFYPDESTGIDPERVPGLRYPGMLLSPDKYDRVGWPGQSTVVPLRSDQYEQLAAWVEGLQAGRRTGALVFDMVDRNCAGFVAEAAALVGVEVKSDQPILGFLPGWMHLPGRLSSWLLPLRRLIYRLGLGFFGGFSTLDWYWVREEAGVRRQPVTGQTPLFQGVKDLLFKQVPFNHVRAIQDWQKARAGQRAISDRLSEASSIADVGQAGVKGNG
ncbi:hypothetical protein [Roseibium litorale]|uniref:DUF4105 domain-containing protein n=1 Tax=Roseibium litorale TaxID=2803841 RepID=A0ABR9CIX4_9HYPH|nr:hypothetical protein [Roseibium litorale]MBD8890589.1 hypothetical protein [Roseibium litorale]